MCLKRILAAIQRLARSASVPLEPHATWQELQDLVAGRPPRPGLLEHLCRCRPCLDLALWELAEADPDAAATDPRRLDRAWARLQEILRDAGYRAGPRGLWLARADGEPDRGSGCGEAG
jgi:hypothetical protein